MTNLFDSLTLALYGNLYWAFLASFCWGVLSIVISPCHLASIPLMIGYINEQKQISIKKAFFISTNFSIGILFTLLIAAIVASIFGLMLGLSDLILKLFIGVLLLIVGLFFLNIISLPDFGSSKDLRIKNRPYLSSILMGLVFGATLGPCALAFMAPVLSIVMQSIKDRFLFSSGLILFFIFGHCIILIFFGTFTSIIKKYLNWGVTSKGTSFVRKICGILIVLGGLFTIVTQFI